MLSDIWIMNINGDNLVKLVSEDASLVYPTWSPDEKYIAYLTYSALSQGSTAYRKISFYNLRNKDKFEFSTSSILPPNTANTYNYLPIGNLSWVN